MGKLIETQSSKGAERLARAVDLLILIGQRLFSFRPFADNDDIVPSTNQNLKKIKQKPSAAPKLVAALAAVAVAAFSPAAPAFAGDLVLGAKVFSNTCITCHSGGQNILESDKTLEREALEQYLDGGFSEASIVKQVGFDFGAEGDGGRRGAGARRGGAGRQKSPVSFSDERRRGLPAAAPLPAASSSAPFASTGLSRAAAERLTFYPVLTARSRPRAWLPKLGLGGAAAAPRGGAGASAARAKTIADFLVGAPPVSQPPSSAAAAEC